IGRLIAGAIERDETDRAIAETELRLAESSRLEAVGRLAGRVAHDFNNLLTIVVGNTDLLLREDAPADGEERAAIFREIQSAATRGADMVVQLLAFARDEP